MRCLCGSGDPRTPPNPPLPSPAWTPKGRERVLPAIPNKFRIEKDRRVTKQNTKTDRNVKYVAEPCQNRLRTQNSICIAALMCQMDCVGPNRKARRISFGWQHLAEELQHLRCKILETRVHTYPGPMHTKEHRMGPCDREYIGKHRCLSNSSRPRGKQRLRVARRKRALQ